jgi:putative nucleotidyltransferase with HDIG domain
MVAASSVNRTTLLSGGLAFGSLLAAVILAAADPAPLAFNWNWLLLAALSLLAELWPVSIFRRGMRITFTMAYLVGIAALAGPFHALLIDVFVTLIAALSIRYVHQLRVEMKWVIVNLSIAMLSSACAGFVWLAVQQSQLPGAASLVLSVLGYVVFYSVINFLGVTAVDRSLNGPESRESILESLRPGVQSVGLYFAVALLVALLVKLDFTPYAALTVVPIATLRHALINQARLYDHYYDTISALSLMLQRVHPYTSGHLRRVSEIAEEVALQLGLSPRNARLVREAAVLHDIGKIAVDEDILDKPSRLTDEEYEHVKMHSIYGARILEPVEAFQPIVKWIRHHHERPDGTGYPDQLSDIEIPIESKIIAVVDAYDAMTGSEDGGEKRSYREPMTPEQAMAELERCAGTQFDRDVVQTFRKVVLGGVS